MSVSSPTTPKTGAKASSVFARRCRASRSDVALDRLGGQIAARAGVRLDLQPPSRFRAHAQGRSLGDLGDHVRLRGRLAAQLGPLGGDDGRRVLAAAARGSVVARVQQDEDGGERRGDETEARGERPEFREQTAARPGRGLGGAHRFGRM